MLKRIAGFLAASIVAGVLLSGAASSQQPAAITDAPPISGVAPDHATLSVDNIDIEAAWYERVLGFKALQRNDSNPNVINQQMYIPGFRIDLLKAKGSSRPPKVQAPYLQQGWVHVVFHVPDLAKALTQVQALHVTPQSIERDSKGALMEIRLRDPEDNEVSFICAEQ